LKIGVKYAALELLARFWAMCTAHGVFALGARSQVHLFKG